MSDLNPRMLDANPRMGRFTVSEEISSGFESNNSFGREHL
jgi:hypothetical protein